VPHADVVTTTTHKTLRGPRGGMILSRSEHAQAIDRAVFPGLQGGPHVHNTAALAVALREAAQPAFKDYAKKVVANARVLAEGLMARGFDVVSGGTDNHLILVDLTSKNVPGKVAAKALDKAGIELNYNSVPYDTRKPFDPSGIRLGSPSVTSRGMGEAEMKQIAVWMDRVVGSPDDATAEKVAGEVRELTRKFPAPGISG
jgi:glycine hydroxymethyltransferase